MQKDVTSLWKKNSLFLHCVSIFMALLMCFSLLPDKAAADVPGQYEIVEVVEEGLVLLD